MGKIYRSRTGLATMVNGVAITNKMVATTDPVMDDLVGANLFLVDDVLTSQVVAGGTVRLNRIVEQDSSAKGIESTGPGTDFIGVSASEAVADGNLNVVSVGKAVVMCGEINIAQGNKIVAAPGGVAAIALASAHVMANAETTTADDDFANSVWKAGGEVINVKTSIDIAGARGKLVAVQFLDEAGVYRTEVLTLDGTDSSTVVSGTLLCTKLLAVSAQAGIVGGDLVVEDEDGNDCIAITAPTGDEVYGQVACAASTDAKGQKAKLTCNAAATGKILVVGTDALGGAITEIVTFAAAASMYTVNAYKTITHLLVGDDGVATKTWTVQIDANTDGQVIGFTRYQALVARAAGLVELGAV